MALDKNEIIATMKERGFVVYATIGDNKLQFVSERMYDPICTDKRLLRQQMPVINIFVKLDTDEFYCVYNLSSGINTLNSPICGSVMNNDHFDRIVCQFELQARWLSRLN